MRSTIRFAGYQLGLVAGAVVAYFGVRGLTEGDPDAAQRNAEWILAVERALQLDVEHRVQDLTGIYDWTTTGANWVYIWVHWPVVIATLVLLAWFRRRNYLELRNAMIVSGLIGLLIFATFPVTPPRLFSPEFVDTVTERSTSYRMLQPPAFVNRYAALPSLHFGWNLLVGVEWYRTARTGWMRVAAFVMPAAMAWSVVATANHWVIDVIVGGAVALIGLELVIEPPAPLTVPVASDSVASGSIEVDSQPLVATTAGSPCDSRQRRTSARPRREACGEDASANAAAATGTSRRGSARRA